MFRVLSNEESHLVKKWRAPNLRNSAESSSPLAGRSIRSLDSEDLAITDIANLRQEVRDAHANTQASNDDLTNEKEHTIDASGSHASLAMLSPSADMLQQTYDEGFSAGVQASKSQADGMAADTLVSLLDKLAPQKYQIDADIEQEVVSLAKAIAKMLLRREVETEDGVILDIVQKALAQMPMTTETPTVVLHPMDLAIVQSMQTPPLLARLIPDAEMMRGDCRIESGASILEAGVQALVESISSSSTQVLQNHADTKQANSVDNIKADE